LEESDGFDITEGLLEVCRWVVGYGLAVAGRLSESTVGAVGIGRDSADALAKADSGDDWKDVTSGIASSRLCILTMVCSISIRVLWRRKNMV
jgi:hypothetical protein